MERLEQERNHLKHDNDKLEAKVSLAKYSSMNAADDFDMTSCNYEIFARD